MARRKPQARTIDGIVKHYLECRKLQEPEMVCLHCPDIIAVAARYRIPVLASKTLAARYLPCPRPLPEKKAWALEAFLEKASDEQLEALVERLKVHSEFKRIPIIK